MPLILNNQLPIHWAVAGVGIAAVTIILLFVANRRLGISSGLEDLCSLVVSEPYFRRSAVRTGREWRLPLLAGLVLGGVLSAQLSGGWAPTWSLGMFDSVLMAGRLAASSRVGGVTRSLIQRDRRGIGIGSSRIASSGPVICARSPGKRERSRCSPIRRSDLRVKRSSWRRTATHRSR